MMKEQVIRDINNKLGDPPLVVDLRLHFGSARMISADDPWPAAGLMQRRARPPALVPPPVVTANRWRRSPVNPRRSTIELRTLIEQVRTRWDR
jgi:hypothetical protein